MYSHFVVTHVTGMLKSLSKKKERGMDMRRKFKIEASSYNSNPTSQILKKGAMEYNGYYIVEDIAGDGYNVYDENFSLVEEGCGSLGSAKECIEELVENDPERIHCATEEEETQYSADMANGIQEVEDEVVQGGEVNSSSELFKQGQHVILENGMTGVVHRDQKEGQEQIEVMIDGLNEIKRPWVWTVRENPEEPIQSASVPDYGGAFDIEPEQYFTREEINEVGEEVCERLAPMFNTTFKINELYMDDKGQNSLTMEIEAENGECFFANAKVDLRWGKNPRSILLKCVKVFVDKFDKAINQTSFELSSSVDVESSQSVESAVYHNRRPEPKRYNEDESEEYVETHLDAVILMDENGSWTYEDESYPWARSEEDKEGNWYANEHSNVKIADPIDVVEKVDELLVSLLPEDPGRYHIQGSVTLTFNLSGIEYDETFYGWTEEEGNVVDRDYYTDDAEVEFISDKSSIDHFEWKMVGPGEEVEVQAQEDVDATSDIYVGHWTVAEGPKKTAARGYDNWTLLQKSGEGVTPRYALYDNNIESFDQADGYTFQLSKLSPYDNTEYVWCRFKDQMASYYRAGKLQCHESMIENLDNFEEVAEWQNFIIERCLARLESFNSKLKSNIDHS